jgi:hypothetical protein
MNSFTFQFSQINQREKEQNFLRYALLISTYNPPPYFYEALEKFISIQEIDIFIIDSSPTDSVPIKTSLITSSISNLNKNIFYYKVPNCGQPFKLNFGLQQVNEKGYNLATILTDDTELAYKTFPAHKIYNYFYENCDPNKDIMILPYNAKTLKMKNTFRHPDIGMTLDLRLFRKICFREDLIMDQFDHFFCYNIYENGGKILIYPEVLIKTLPLGRMEKSGLPDWRLYLLTRNTIALFLEHKNNFFRDVILNFGHYIKPILYGSRRIKYLKAFLLGLIDGLKHNLGITENLQLLSGPRFQIECNYWFVQHSPCKDKVSLKYSSPYNGKGGI